MKKIFLVDTENVNITALYGANNLCEEDIIILFVTRRTNLCSFSEDKLKCINTKANIIKINVLTGVKNSLDFQLVSYLGFIIGEHRYEANNYYIVSHDKGYLSSINLLQNCSKYNIQLIDDIFTLYKDNDIDCIIDKFVDKGFRYKTAIKMALILVNSIDLDMAKNNFLKEFGFNQTILESCIDILNDYYKDNTNNQIA